MALDESLAMQLRQQPADWNLAMQVSDRDVGESVAMASDPDANEQEHKAIPSKQHISGWSRVAAMHTLN